MRGMGQDAEIERAVDLQERSYRLLQWLGEAVRRGFIRSEDAHAFTADLGSAAAWIRRHRSDLPADAQPAADDLEAFCRLFVGGLQDSLYLADDAAPSPPADNGRCGCRQCRYWQAPVVRARHLRDGDRRRADRCMRASLDEFALSHERVLEDGQVAALMRETAVREALALHAYAEVLLQRVRGAGSAVGVPLALWRRFAWTETGMAKRGFRLQAAAIHAARQLLAQRIVAIAPPL